MSESYLEIQLDQQPIELCKLLKIADLVTGGGEAKIVISEGYVLLNGEVEYQKRKKVYHNDIVEFNGEVIQVIVDENLQHENQVDDDFIEVIQPSTYAQTNQQQNDKQKKAVSPKDDTAKQHKRKPISF
jgi:ribosome-associated protein